MRKLLSANFIRLFRSQVFWVLEAACAITGASIYLLAVINTREIGELWYLNNGNYYFFLGVIYIGFVMAVFSGFYIGVEYSDGTIRNKLTVGHSRESIYLANMIVSFAAGLLFTVTHIAASLCIGLPLLGGLVWEALDLTLWRVLTGMVLIFCYATIFTFFAMLDKSRSRNVIVSFVLAMVISLGGLYTYSRLQEPEITTQMVMQEDGSFLRQDVENERYLEGADRQIYTVLDALLPSSQALNICRNDGQFSALSIVCLFGVSALFTGGGIASFKMKDIK